MEENVQKELEAVKGMVLAWKESYLQGAPSADDAEVLAHDLMEEIENQVYPYVRRMYESSFLNQKEFEQFMQFCYSQVDDLRAALAPAEVENDDIVRPQGSERESFDPHRAG